MTLLRLPTLTLLAATALHSQEAAAGFELRGTVGVAGTFSDLPERAPRNGSSFTGGVRAVFYPTWKLSSRWAISAAVQTYSRPYFVEQFTTQGYGFRADVLQAALSYTRFWNRNSFVFRAGQLSSAFGSFLLRYDDAANPLIGMPQSYGYYYKGVTTLALTGAQADVTFGNADLRLQFTTSSPSNRRGILDDGQYGNWTAGGGYALGQGFRVGASVNRGPYLHRQHRFYFRGEADPKSLPATAVGLDAQFGHGPWTVNAEWQRFVLPYRAIPDLKQHIGYAELRRVLHPRWYVAVRPGYLRASAYPGDNTLEAVAAYRPNRFQTIKAGYMTFWNPRTHVRSNSILFQLVTTIAPITFAPN